jgi:hypothetical protein
MTAQQQLLHPVRIPLTGPDCSVTQAGGNTQANRCVDFTGDSNQSLHMVWTASDAISPQLLFTLGPGKAPLACFSVPHVP